MQVGLARAARTDAGVHAAGNLVSLKMIITIPGVRDIVARINEELPPEIRLWNYVRTQNSFNARLSVHPPPLHMTVGFFCADFTYSESVKAANTRISFQLIC